MPANAPAPPRARAAARLPRHARRDQLVAAALPLAARGGLTQLALDHVAARAGVTRNLLYHYFPRGRRDLEIAVATEAERLLDLSGPGESDPLPWMLDNALAPTHAWRVHRWSEGSADPEIRQIAGGGVHAVVLKLSRLHLGTGDPEPLFLTALRGYVAFAETALDSGRAMALARPALAELLTRTLEATLAALRA